MSHDGIPAQNGWTFRTLSFHGFDTCSNMKVEIQYAICNMSVWQVCTFEARLLAQILHKFGIDGTFALVCLKISLNQIANDRIISYPWVRKRSITNTITLVWGHFSETAKIHGIWNINHSKHDIRCSLLLTWEIQEPVAKLKAWLKQHPSCPFLTLQSTVHTWVHLFWTLSFKAKK